MIHHTTHCEWVNGSDSFTCAKCGAKRSKPITRNCTAQQPNGLGDRIERWLTSYGITEDRYKEIKQKFGLPANCGCGKRKQWFNKVGAYLGISADTYGPNKETK